MWIDGDEQPTEVEADADYEKGWDAADAAEGDKGAEPPGPPLEEIFPEEDDDDEPRQKAAPEPASDDGDDKADAEPAKQAEPAKKAAPPSGIEDRLGRLEQLITNMVTGAQGQQQQASPPQAAPAPPPPAELPKAVEERIAKLAEVDPESAAAMTDIAKSMAAEFGQVRHDVARYDMEKGHAKVRQILSDKIDENELGEILQGRSKAFDNYLDTLTRKEVREIQQSSDPDVVATAIEAYVNAMHKGADISRSGDSADEEEVENVRRTAMQRDARKRSGAGVRQRRPSDVGKDSDYETFEDGWNLAAREEARLEKENRARDPMTGRFI